MKMLIRRAVVLLVAAAVSVAMASPSSAGDGLLIGRYSTPEMADVIAYAPRVVEVPPVPAPVPEVAPAPVVASAPVAPAPQRADVPAPAVAAPEVAAPPVVEVSVVDLHDDAAAPDAAQAGPGGAEVPTGVVQTPIAENIDPTVTP